MSHESDVAAATAVIHQINNVWLSGRPDEMAPLLSDDVALTVPGFQATIQGKDQFLGGYRAFCETDILQVAWRTMLDIAEEPAG